MKRIKTHLIYCLLLFCLLPTWSKQKTEHPNIILILSDDQGYGDISEHGNSHLNTPHMDQLYRESARFSNFVVSATCAPTRCALMTGKHEFKSGVAHTVAGRREMNLASTTVAQLLKQAGYTTGIFGKWHLGSNGAYRPEHRGFDVSVGTVDDTQNSHFDPSLLFNGQKKDCKGFRTDILFDEATKFIENNSDQPFFCYIPTYSPHMPLKAPQKYIDQNNGNVFYAMISNIDDNIGRLMKRLKELHLDANTLVIFINDNGGTKGVDKYNANMRGCKATPWYGATRAFSFWRWQGHIQARDIDQLAGHIDVLPTLVDYAQAKISKKLGKELDGISLQALLTQEEEDTLPERMIISHLGRWPNGENEVEAHKYAFCSVHWNNYQLVSSQSCNNKACDGECRVFNKIKKGGFNSIYSQNGAFHYAMNPNKSWMLFDIHNDPAQTKDIAASHPRTVAKMKKEYEEWWQEVYPVVQDRQNEIILKEKYNE